MTVADMGAWQAALPGLIVAGTALVVMTLDLFMRGPDDGWLRVALDEDSGIKLDAFRERLRKFHPERVVPWLAHRLEQGGGGLPEAERGNRLSCPPSDSSRATS